jgi:hypothetical protein
MNCTLLRSAAFFCVFALAACGGRSIVPAQNPSTSGAPFAPALSPDVTNPCKTVSSAGFWFFKGSCVAGNVKPKSTTFKLKSYKGITQTLSFGTVKGSVPPATTFVVGDGTSDKDITGTFENYKFPIYGTVQCWNQNNSQTACVGKAIVYDLVVNASQTTVSWVATPSIAITAPAALAHKKRCTLNQMTPEGGLIYFVSSVTGKVKNGKVVLPHLKTTFALGGQIATVLAISCD